MATREPIPTYPYGREENRILYDRFHALMHKAGRKGAIFAWTKFSDFLEDVMQRAPDGYYPSAYRMYFELNEDDPSYNAETMRFSPGHSLRRTFRSPKPAKSTTRDRAVQGVYEGKLAAELAVLLLTEDGGINELAGIAGDHLQTERDNEQDLYPDPEDCRAEDCLA